MIVTFFRKLAFALGLIGVIVGLGVGSAAAANNQLCPANAPPAVLASEVCKNQTDPIAGPGGIVADVTAIVAIAAGIIAVVMIMYGGFQYITAGGDSGKIQEAKKTILWSVVGLVVIVLARSIIMFVINRV